ncbi:MAG: efflux RND transporter permease subunit, partial [Pseudomonadales bacterium]|nr:efflux RND transporter permease subunit [Pseudomonadales bacterium]
KKKKFIKDEVDLIMSNGLTGLILVVITLLVFLQFRVATWVMIGMPVTFLAALLAFYYLGGTLNVLSLIAIVMALGIVVDDAIVVGEEAVTQFQSGKKPAEAASVGANRMFFPVVASSLTTLCAFLPLLERDANPIAEIPLMMLCVIAASLLECFLILPGHLKSAFEKSAGKPPSKFHQWFDAKFEDFRENRFRPVVRLAMQNRRVVIGSAFAMFALTLAMWITGWIKTDMNLNINFEQLDADVQFVAGTTDAQRVAFIADLEKSLSRADESFGGHNVVNYITTYNAATVNNEQKTGSQYAKIWVEMTSPEKRSVTASEFASDWLAQVPNSQVVDSLTIKKSSEYWGDFSILLKGADAEVLKKAAAETIAELGTLDGVTNLRDNLPWGKEQWIFELTTEGRALGLTTSGVGQQLRAAYDGQRIQIFQQDENELEVRLMLPENERTDLASLSQFPVKTPGGKMIPLASVATWEGKRGLDVIRHHNALRTIEVSGDVDINKITGGEVVDYFNKNLKERLSTTYHITTGLDGLSLEGQEVGASFATKYMIALCLIYIVLAWVFASYSWPLAVMAAIPFGLTGALLGHFVMGMVIGPMSMLGLFTLTGIIINDSIILVSAYQYLLKEGIEPRQAIEDAVCSRLRAVILTSVTTVAGLFPLLLERAPMAAAFTPLAAAICFGMLYGTLLVLLVVPALLSSIVTMTEWFEARRRRKSHEGPAYEVA